MPADRSLVADPKADFSDIYTQPDPREYYRTLHALDYQVRQQAVPVFRAVLAASRRAGRTRTVLDLCCSYGVNSAMLLSREDPSRVAARYADPRLAALSPSELAERDR